MQKPLTSASTKPPPIDDCGPAMSSGRTTAGPRRRRGKRRHGLHRALDVQRFNGVYRKDWPALGSAIDERNASAGPSRPTPNPQSAARLVGQILVSISGSENLSAKVRRCMVKKP